MEVWKGIWKKILVWNGIWKKILVWNGIWNGRFLVWNGNGMEENCQYGKGKNRLPFHSIPCPARKSQNQEGKLTAAKSALAGMKGYLKITHKTT